MAQHQMTTPTLAQRVSLDRTVLWRLLSGRRAFTADELYAIAQTFGRRTSEIVAMAEAIEKAGFSPTPISIQSQPTGGPPNSQ